tara:strand:+ start:133 stop:510 length:378 start_codon:yes stop_codon:yes gene_type:complete
MNKVANILNFIKEDLYKNQKSRNCVQFFQKSLLHFSISLEIGFGSYSKKYLSYEKLCESIPKKFGSRSTIQAILNDAVEEGYFLKEIHNLDRRIKIYRYSSDFSNAVEKWLDNSASEIFKFNNFN